MSIMAVLADGRARADGRAGEPFRNYAPEKIEYGITRYTNDVNRLYGDKRLAALAGCARTKAWPGLNDFPHLKRWFEG